jgi:hypothetical protein
LRHCPGLVGQRLLDATAEAVPHQPLGRGEREAWPGGELACQRLALLGQALGGNDLRDETGVERLGRRVDGVGEDELQRLAVADQLRERDGRAAVGRHPDARRARQEARRLGGDHDVRRAHKADPAAARGEPLDQRHDRRGQRDQRLRADPEPRRRLAEVVRERLTL